VSFRLKLFIAALSSALVALLLAGGLLITSARRQTDARIEDTLVVQARVAAEIIGRMDARPAERFTPAEIDREADRLGSLTGARVTLVASDGVVVGDSSEELGALAAMENHLARPEILDAQARGLGRARRFSATLNIDMLYVAARVDHPAIGFVRLALPLTEVRSQLRAALAATLAALGLALVGAAPGPGPNRRAPWRRCRARRGRSRDPKEPGLPADSDPRPPRSNGPDRQAGPTRRRR